MINWQTRIKSKEFWIGIVGVLVSAITGIAAQFGVEVDLGQYSEGATVIITSVFAILGVIGVVNDPTTKGLSDSQQAMLYTAPNDDKPIESNEENAPTETQPYTDDVEKEIAESVEARKSEEDAED